MRFKDTFEMLFNVTALLIFFTYNEDSKKRINPMQSYEISLFIFILEILSRRLEIMISYF